VRILNNGTARPKREGNFWRDDGTESSGTGVRERARSEQKDNSNGGGRKENLELDTERQRRTRISSPKMSSEEVHLGKKQLRDGNSVILDCSGPQK